jgi:hypothetical protein
MSAVIPDEIKERKSQNAGELAVRPAIWPKSGIDRLQKNASLIRVPSIGAAE